MKRTAIWIALGSALGIAMWHSTITQAGQSGAGAARTLYQQALHEEDATGNLKSAIALYERVLAAKPDRALAAESLMHMAGCYEKLGNRESQKIYTRIVTEFPDQKDQVALARARLGGSDGLTNSASERQIRIDPDAAFPGTVSGDGRFIPYIDRATYDIFVRDLKTGTDRLLSKGIAAEVGGVIGYPLISRDGKQVAFNRHLARTQGEVELDLVNNALGPGAPQVRRLLAFSNKDAEIAPRDLSPDGKWIVALLLKPDPQVALISTQDGNVHILKTLLWGFPRNIFFSPDSRYIAYSLPVPDTRNQTDVLILAIDGSRETTVVHHPSENLVMGWSPDSASLLFASDRNGSLGLWSLPVNDGKAQGNPALVRATVGSNPVSLGVTTSGAVYLWRYAANFYLQVSTVDLNIGKISPDPVKLRVFVGEGGKPSWSSDGKYLAYTSCPQSCDSSSTIDIRNMETGQVRELWPKDLRYLQGPSDLAWSADGRSLTVAATDMKGRRGNYVIDTQTGEVFPTDANLPSNTNVTADGMKRYRAVGGSIVETENGKDRVIFQERAPGNRVSINSSPDRRYTAFIETTSSQSAALLVMPYGGGKPTELLRAPAAGAFSEFFISWTPDSRAILAMKTSDHHKELWLVPMSDGEPRKLDIEVGNWSTNRFPFQLGPDGRQIAFVAGDTKEEIVGLENLLPTPKAAK